MAETINKHHDLHCTKPELQNQQQHPSILQGL